MSDSYMGGVAAKGSQPGPTDPLDILTSETWSGLTQPNPGNMSLSEEDLKAMNKRIQEISQLEEDDESADVGMDEDAEPVLDLEDQNRRTEKLKGILSTLAQLWWSDSDQLDSVVEKLADGCRNSKWRIPMGQSGVLNFLLEIFSAHTLRHSLKIHVLRLIGNSCADTDENRARVIASNYIPSIIFQLKDSSLIPFAIPVLYNICIDYEPAQQRACTAGLTNELIDLMSGPRFNDSRVFLGYICKLMDLMVTQPTDLELAPENTAKILLQVAADREHPADMEDFIAVVNTAVAYFKHEKFQKALLVPGAMDITLAVLVDSYTRFDSHPSIGSSEIDQEDAKALQKMRADFNQVLSDVSALPEFKETCPVISPFTSALRRWLLSPQLQLQVCACIMLGNLARSDEACQQFVHTSRVHLPLITILKEATDSQLLHAALGFLKNLALPAQNKEILGASGLFEVLPRLWALDTLQQIQFSSISLARQLTIGNYKNVKMVCKRLSKDENSPAHSRTNLSILIALFDRTDVEPIKMEIARLITSVCRVTNSTGAGGQSPETLEAIRKKFFTMHPDVGKPLSFMVSQTKWPVVRSEGWFVFALMARYPEGAKCISDLLHDVAVFQPLVEILTGKQLIDYKPPPPLDVTSTSSSISTTNSSPEKSSSPPLSSSTSISLVDSATGLTVEPQSPSQTTPNQSSEMARIDRENALVLVSEMLKNRGSEMALMRRTLFEGLLQGGSEMLLSYREARPGYGGAKPRSERIRAGLGLQEAVGQSVEEFS